MDHTCLGVALMAHALHMEPVVDRGTVLSAEASGRQSCPLLQLSREPRRALRQTDAGLPAPPACPAPYGRVSTSSVPAGVGAWRAKRASLIGKPLSHLSESPRRPSEVPTPTRPRRRSRFLRRRRSMQHLSPPAPDLGPDRGPLEDIVARTRGRAHQALEQAAFPIRGTTPGCRPAPALPDVGYTNPLQRTTTDVQDFDLWYHTSLDVANEVGSLVTQTVGIRVRVAAAVEEDAGPGGRLGCTVRVVNFGLEFDGQLAVLDRKARRRSRVVGYYLESLSVRVAAVPPPGGAAVVEQVGGRGGADAAVEGISIITQGIAETRGRKFGATVGAGGEGGLLPAVSLTGERERSRTAEVTAETSQPAWDWSGTIRQRKTAEGTAAAWVGVVNTPIPTYVEWTWSLVCWSTGHPYNAAKIFNRNEPVWPRMATKLAVPAQMEGVAEMCSLMSVYTENSAPWDRHFAEERVRAGVRAGEKHSRVSRRGGRDRSPPLPALPAGGDSRAAVGKPLCGTGLKLAILQPRPLGPPTLHAPPPAMQTAPRTPRRGQRKCRRVTLALELAPALILHRQNFSRLTRGQVESARWPPPGAAPEVGVQRFLIRVKVKEREGAVQ